MNLFSYFWAHFCRNPTNTHGKRLRWSRGSCCLSVPKFAGLNPVEAVRIFQGEKILSTPSFGREVKPWVPCRRFAACKRSLNWRGSRNLRQNFRLFLVHIVRPGSLESWGDVVASVGERGNVQTRGGNRVSTISLLGCSTYVALTTGPTDEEHSWQRKPFRPVT